MKTIILNQRKERDELLSRPYLTRRNSHDSDMLLSSHLIKLITGPRRVGKSTQALLMLRNKNFAYLNFDSQALLDFWDANLVMRMLNDVYPGYEYILLDEVQNLDAWDLCITGTDPLIQASKCEAGLKMRAPYQGRPRRGRR